MSNQLKFDSIPILGVDYRVRQLSQQIIAQLTGSPDCLGFCDDMEEDIILASELKGRGLAKILIHEWAHGVNNVNGLNQTLDPVVAESVSHSFAHAFLELLGEKEVVSFLLKNLSRK